MQKIRKAKESDKKAIDDCIKIENFYIIKNEKEII